MIFLLKKSSLQLCHTYPRKIDKHINIDQQYADDIGSASPNTEKVEEIENTVPHILKNRNLMVNESKTEKYTVERKSLANNLYIYIFVKYTETKTFY